MAGLSQRDRDSLIRTIIGEAGGEGPDGQAAVAHVVLNRLAEGGFGDNLTQIVTAPNQFEPWNTRDGLRRMDVAPDAPAYQNAAGVVDRVLSGATPDPTGGATHFFAPKAQAALGRQPPAWAKDPTAQIGGHVFFAPNGPANATDAIRQVAPSVSVADALGYTGQQPTAQSAPMTDDFDKRWGIGQASEPAAAVPDDFDKRWGITAPAPAQSQPAASGGGANAVANAALGGMIEGVPIVGPAIKSGAQKAAAAVRSVLNDSKYSDELRFVQDATKKIAEDHPYVHTGGEIAGAVAGMLPLGATAVGSKMLGLTGPSLASRMIYGTVGNSLVGTADATARGDSPLAGGFFGGVGGMAGPLVGQVAGAGVNKLTGAVQGMIPTGVPGMSRSSANLLGTVVSADDPTAIRSFLAQHGDQAMLADAGPSTMGLAGGLASKPSEAKSIITNKLMGRAAGSNDRIGTQLDASLGPAEDPKMVADAIKSARSVVNSRYSAIHAVAPPVDASPVVAAIDSRLENATGSQRTALQSLRNELVKTPASDTQPEVLHDSSERLHNLRKDVDQLLSGKAPALGVERGAVASKNGALAEVRNNLDDVLKTQVPGMAETDAASAALADRQNAVDRGFNNILGGSSPHPQTFAADRAAADPGVNIAENKGIRGRIDRMFGKGTQRDAVTLNKLLAGGEDGYSAANLKTAFGDHPVNALLDTLAREKAFNATTNEVVQNSASARRIAANKLLEDTQPGGQSLMNASLGGMAAQAGKSMIVDPLIRMIMESPNAPRNLEIAKALTAQGASRDQILESILRLNQRQGVISNAGNALSNALAGGTNRLMLGAGATMRP